MECKAITKIPLLRQFSPLNVLLSNQSADLDVQLMQLNHCDGVLGDYSEIPLKLIDNSTFMSRFVLAIF